MAVYKIAEVRIAVKLGEAVVKILTRMDEIEKKLGKCEKNIAISGLEYVAFDTSRSEKTSMSKKPAFEAQVGGKDDKKDKFSCSC